MREMTFQLRKLCEIFIELLFAVEPAVHDPPGTRPAIDEGEISFAHAFVQLAIRFGEEIAQFYLRTRVNARETVPHTARGAVVSLPKAGGEDEDSLHDSLGQERRAKRRKFNGYLCVAK